MQRRQDALEAQRADADKELEARRKEASVAAKRRGLSPSCRGRTGKSGKTSGNWAAGTQTGTARRDGRQAALRQLTVAKAFLADREVEAERLRVELVNLVSRQRTELERIAGLPADEARTLVLKAVEEESRHEAARLTRDIEEKAKEEGNRRARNIITMAIQRCAVEQTSETTVAVVPLPSDDVKGRIIGREGRNIRSFETLTGVDVVIDDTPEAVVISSFDPVRREAARIALSNLIADGRIHPGRIEEMVERAQIEVEERMREAGEMGCSGNGRHGTSSRIAAAGGTNALSYLIWTEYLEPFD